MSKWRTEYDKIRFNRDNNVHSMVKIKRILQKRALKIRQKRFKKLKLNTQNISILSSNCWGGELYHDARLRFLSPTINLTFDPIDFLVFVKRIKEIDNTTLIEEKTDKPYPVGLLKYSDSECLRIYFVHYNSFEEAKNIFYKRASRITDKIVVLLMVSDLTKEIIDGFNSIPFKKICIYGDTSEKVLNNSQFIQFKRIKTSKRDVLSFKSYLTGKRIIDEVDFDYYRFLFGGDSY